MAKHVSVILLGIVVAAILCGSVFYLANNYLSRPSVAASTIVACPRLGVNHQVLVKDSQASPKSTIAKVCDQLTIVNQDDRLRLMAFGEHEHHQAYDGVTEKVLGYNQQLTVTLNELGTYYFHDHIEDAVNGQFTVNR